MDLEAISRALLEWFAANRRDLPWRETYDPYHVLVSEIMLQQTQMERVVEYFRRWIGRFPDVASLAGADEDEVLRLWQGLGYYRRAKNLLAAARAVAGEHGGRIPDDMGGLLALPGVGPYTAAAVAGIAYERDEPLADANVARVLARIFDVDQPVASGPGKRRILELAAKLLPKGRARDHNQALMELGALVCTPRNPDCGRCPAAPWCRARELNLAAHRPLPGKRLETIPIPMATGVLAVDGLVFIQKRRPDDVWPGLWEFPGGVVEAGETPEQALAREYMEEVELAVEVLAPIAVVRHTYTRHRVTLNGFYCRALGRELPGPLHAAVEGRFVPPEKLSAFAFPAGHRQLLEIMAEDGFAALKAAFGADR